MNIVLAAEEAAGVQALRLAASSTHRVTAVLTGGTGHGERRGVTVRDVAADLGIPVLPAANVQDPQFAVELNRQAVDVLLNVHSLFVICPEVLGAPRRGAFNLHPGPLPEYAGLDVPSWAVYHGRTRHGVTLHWMVPAVDAGPVAFAAEVALTEEDTGLSASAKCVPAGLSLVSELLEHLAENEPIPAVAQDLTRRRYHPRRPPHGGWVPWSGPAREVVNLVRACDYLPWPSPWGLARAAPVGGSVVEVVRAELTGRATNAEPGTVGAAEVRGVLVATADEWVLVRRARVDGCSVSPASAFEPGAQLTLPPTDPIRCGQREF